MAFHLGCLRALHDRGLLDRVTVISSVSGGSVLAALYCSHAGDFPSFEARARRILARGFLVPALLVAVTSLEGARAMLATLPLLIDRTAALLVRSALAIAGRGGRVRFRWLHESPFRRWASRTTILRRAFSRIYGGRRLGDLLPTRPRLIVVACELRAKAAFYFTAERLHCWRYGTADAAGVELAHAVSASAAYPLALPAIDAHFRFERPGEAAERHRVVLTDGGVYDNLGLAPLWPDRDPRIGLTVDPVDFIVACRAGYGLQVANPPAFVASRMAAAFESIFARAQNLAMGRLFDLARAGRIEGFILPYLDQDDEKLAQRPAGFVSSASIAGYPTDFSAMSPEWIDLLAARGRQLTDILLDAHLR